MIDQSEGTGYFGGSYDSESRTYSFRLTRHIQNILTGDTTKNLDLYISAVNPLIKYPLHQPGRPQRRPSPYDPSRYPGEAAVSGCSSQNSR
ncbi:MAG: hypothetical protein MZV63_55485 [Marinilabiliales bacterium]|nr:hypothetical protein [Marinilabiliales bacterium]